MDAEDEFVFQWVREFVAGKEDIRILQELTGRKEVLFIEGFEGCGLVTHFLIMLPSVWSSLFIVKIAAFVTLVSNSLIILE